MLPIILSILFAARIVIDVVYSESKPGFVVAIYTFSIVLASLFLIAKSERDKGMKNIASILFLTVALLASLVKGNVGFVGHLNYSLQVLIPALFLLSCTSRPLVIQDASKLFRKLFAIPALILIILHVIYGYVTRNVFGLGFIEYYSNSPNHVIAQTVVKISMVFLMDGVLLSFGIFLLLAVLNVRSTIISFMVSQVIYNKAQFLRKKTIKKIALMLIFVVPLFVYFVDAWYFINRFLFKNYDSDRSSIAYNISSGRTEIMDYYINYMFTDFNFLDWVFGKGPVWLNSSEMTLSAHNDILNILISFGVFGLGFLLYIYYKFFVTLVPAIRLAAVSVFAILFLTNGTVFHQSTIFFALLYFYGFSSTTTGLRLNYKK